MTDPEKHQPLEQGGHQFTGLFIAIPCGSGRIRNETVVSLLDTLNVLNANHIYGEVRIAPMDSLVVRARNTLAAWFMVSKCSHMLCIDDDISWDAKDVLRLIKVDKDFVCGAYRKKTEDECYAVAFPPEAAHKLTICKHCGCVELMNANVGFAMLHRRVFEKMFAAHPELKVDNPPTPGEGVVDNFYALFNTTVEDGTLWGEDYSFARLWRRGGGRVWLDPSISLTHYGTKGWEGNIARWFLKNDQEPIELSDNWKEIPGWLTDQQARVLIREMTDLDPHATVVEFGSWMGRSTAVMGMAAGKLDKDIRVYAIDHFMGSPDETLGPHHDATLDPDGIYPEFLENMDKRGLLGRTVVPRAEEFGTAVARFKDGSIDLAFLDGDHGEGATARLFRLVEPKLKPGGVALFHDYSWATVMRDVRELSIDVHIEHDMAIWRKPKEVQLCATG